MHFLILMFGSHFPRARCACRTTLAANVTLCTLQMSHCARCKCHTARAASEVQQTLQCEMASAHYKCQTARAADVTLRGLQMSHCARCKCHTARAANVTLRSLEMSHGACRRRKTIECETAAHTINVSLCALQLSHCVRLELSHCARCKCHIARAANVTRAANENKYNVKRLARTTNVTLRALQMSHRARWIVTPRAPANVTLRALQVSHRTRLQMSLRALQMTHSQPSPPQPARAQPRARRRRSSRRSTETIPESPRVGNPARLGSFAARAHTHTPLAEHFPFGHNPPHSDIHRYSHAAHTTPMHTETCQEHTNSSHTDSRTQAQRHRDTHKRKANKTHWHQCTKP